MTAHGGQCAPMRLLVSPLAVTRLAAAGIIEAARLGGAAVRGASVLAGRVASEALGVLSPRSAGDVSRDVAGPSERSPMDEPVQAPLTPSGQKSARPRAPRRPPGRTAAVGVDLNSRSRVHLSGADESPRATPPAPPAAPTDRRRPSQQKRKPPMRRTARARPAGSRAASPPVASRPAPAARGSTDAAAAPSPADPSQASALSGSPQGHVSEEPRLVGEFADRGAEDGAGAQVRVEEPWSGYAKLKADEVVDRLVAEPEAVLSLVVLYERAHRGRRSVLTAADKELTRRNPPGARR